MRHRIPLVLTAIFTFVISLALPAVAASPKYNVNHSISPRKQTKTWGCWATATVMLWSWKHGKPTSEEELTSKAGFTYRNLYDSDAGIGADEESAFYKALGLKVVKSVNPSIDAWASYLSKGPVSITVKNDATSYHALVVYALLGGGTAAKTNVSFVDPFKGSTHTEPFSTFVKRYESGVDYKLQIVHW